MEAISKVQEFETSDLFLATYLLVRQFKLTKQPTSKKRYVTFYFERSKGLDGAVQDFFNRTAMCDPLALLEKYRSVKTQAWDAKRLARETAEDGGDEDE